MGPIATTSIIPNGDIAVAGTEDGWLYVFNNSPQPVRLFRVPFLVLSTATSESGSRILAAGGSYVHCYGIDFSRSITSRTDSANPVSDTLYPQLILLSLISLGFGGLVVILIVLRRRVLSGTR